jgi:hypothetical protein
MKFKRIVVSGVFLVALIGGGIIGLLGLARLQSETQTSTLEPGDGASPIVKTLDGTLKVFNSNLPSTWSLDPETTLNTVISFAVTPATRIVTNGVQPQIGMWMRVELESIPSGLLARSIEFQPDPHPIVIEDTLTLVDSALPGVWAIGDYPFLVDSASRITTNGIKPEPGAWARIEMIKLAPDALGQARRYATDIELLSSSAAPGPTDELLDRVHQIDGNTGLWQVGNTQVHVSPSTQVEAGASVNSLVLVRGERSDTGVVRAASVALLPSGDEVFFDGVIQVMNGTTWQVEIRPGTLVSVDVTDSAIQGEPASDRIVRVHGIEVQPGIVDAVHVWLVTGSPFATFTAWLQSVEYTGPLALWRVTVFAGPVPESAHVSLDADVWVDNTEGQVEPGAWLELSAARQGESMYSAEHVRVLPHAPKRVIQGVVEAMPAGTLPGEWVVEGYRVLVTATTGVTGTPRVGSFVTVSGVLSPQGMIRAELITTAAQ